MKQGLPTVEEIARLLKGTVVGDAGDAKKKIRGISNLRNAAPDQLAFLGDPKYIKAARETKAGVLLIGNEFPENFPTTLIRVEKPHKAFAKAATLFTPEPIHWPKEIHPTAVVSPEAEIGEGIHIGPHVVVEAGAEIGDGCHIGAGCYVGHRVVMGLSCFLHPRVTLGERTVLGNHVVIHSGTVTGSDGFGYEFQNGRYEKIPQIGYVQIDDNVEIGANVTIDRGRFDRTWILEGTKIDNLVMIAHNVVIGKHSILVAQSGLSGSVHCGNYVTIAGQSGVAGHLEIGDRVIITARAGVAKDCEPGKIYSSSGHARQRAEIMKIEACTHRLPEFFERVRSLEKMVQEKPAPSSKSPRRKKSSK